MLIKGYKDRIIYLGVCQNRMNFALDPVNVELMQRVLADNSGWKRTPDRLVGERGYANIDRTRAMARAILKKGMLSSKTETELDETIKKISSADSYKSHGAVTDYDEAVQVGLSAEYLTPDSELWKRIWLLYCLYDYDAKEKNLA